ncbi:MAG: hypothetical protein LUE92_17405 [Clostridiales bacterium]|nr:hypothetical protein [Clostridiales bacterium]
MRALEDIFELTDSILPNGAIRVIFFCEVEDRAYEIFYYAIFPNDIRKQCYELVEQGEIDETDLDENFDKIATFIRNSSSFNPDKRNVVTIEVEGSNERVEIEHVSKDVGLYGIKKNWKMKNL